MPQFQVKKVVAVCFLEAVKMAMEQIGAHRLELSAQGMPAPPDLTRVYGDVRRLRDYLQRCASGYGEVVDLDIAPEDAAVLVACCRRSVEAIDVRMKDRVLAEDEQDALLKKQQVLIQWALELAEKPLLDLPLRSLGRLPGDTVRMLTSRLQQKVWGDVRKRPKILPPQSTANTAKFGVPSFGDQVHDMAVPPTDGQADRTASPAPAPQPGRAVPAPDADAKAAPPLFDHRRLCDPRLRALVGVDLRSYSRALGANDYRMATVLMAAVLEGALLDHVLARRGDFGVNGAPDTWNIQDLLLAAMGEAATPKDRSLAFHLFAARNLLRPAVQVVAPTVVTVASFEVLREFAQRALHALGFGAPVGTLPPGEFQDSDFRTTVDPTA